MLACRRVAHATYCHSGAPLDALRITCRGEDAHGSDGGARIQLAYMSPCRGASVLGGIPGPLTVAMRVRSQ